MSDEWTPLPDRNVEHQSYTKDQNESVEHVIQTAPFWGEPNAQYYNEYCCSIHTEQDTLTVIITREQAFDIFYALGQWLEDGSNV